jgi:membrane protein required for colicin V production
VLSGAWFGFSNEFFGLLGLIAAFVITSFAGHMMDGPMATMLPDNAMGHMFGRAIVFLACILVINIAATAAASALRTVISSPVDHSMGVIFGFMRGALIILLPFLLVNLYIDPKVYPDWLVESHSYPYLEAGARQLRHVLPDSEINDRKRTDFAPLTKAAKAAREQEKNLQNMARAKEKESDDEDSTGNSKWKDVIEALKETFPH